MILVWVWSRTPFPAPLLMVLLLICVYLCLNPSFSFSPHPWVCIRPPARVSWRPSVWWVNSCCSAMPQDLSSHPHQAWTACSCQVLPPWSCQACCCEDRVFRHGKSRDFPMFYFSLGLFFVHGQEEGWECQRLCGNYCQLITATNSWLLSSSKHCRLHFMCQGFYNFF